MFASGIPHELTADFRFKIEAGFSDLAAVALEADALHRLADHLGVALSARLLLALLEECNPDAS